MARPPPDRQRYPVWRAPRRPSRAHHCRRGLVAEASPGRRRTRATRAKPEAAIRGTRVLQCGNSVGGPGAAGSVRHPLRGRDGRLRSDDQACAGRPDQAERVGARLIGPGGGRGSCWPSPRSDTNGPGCRSVSGRADLSGRAAAGLAAVSDRGRWYGQIRPAAPPPERLPPLSAPPCLRPDPRRFPAARRPRRPRLRGPGRCPAPGAG